MLKVTSCNFHFSASHEVYACTCTATPGRFQEKSDDPFEKDQKRQPHIKGIKQLRQKLLDLMEVEVPAAATTNLLGQWRREPKPWQHSGLNPTSLTSRAS